MTISEIIQTYRALGLESSLNYNEFNKILITSHSTRIEGSTLTLNETRVLIEDGNTPNGKPILFANQNKDHYEALNFVLKEATQQRILSVAFIQEIAAKVMRTTGEVLTNTLGTVDASKGELRKVRVTAGGVSFMSFEKVPAALEQLVKKLNELLPEQTTEDTQLALSFYAHYELVNIHPFLDGNGRTSRLLMNFIQQWYGLPLGIVFAEDKVAYYEALNSVRTNENFEAYNAFMFSQYAKHLQNEIAKEKEFREKEDKNIEWKF
ncbi:Fic family protein [Capnocytophaga sputigena]|uniref:Fic family protein n=1 Tax=Capnocytophaga sputigena TaxID=1019 RepID=UPI0028EEA272|nr:Fic family protein [Capnocytophaga sputigena]